MFHLFLVGATFSELVNLLLTLSNCVLKQRRNILQFIIWSAWLGFLPLWGAGTGLVGILPHPLIFYLPENTTLPMETMHKTLWNYWIQRSPQDSKPSANKSCAILLCNQSLGVSNLQRGWSFEQIFHTSTTFSNTLVRTNSLYGKRTVHLSSLTSARALCTCEALALLQCHTKPILRKNTLFCSLHWKAL